MGPQGEQAGSCLRVTRILQASQVLSSALVLHRCVRPGRLILVDTGTDGSELQRFWWQTTAPSQGLEESTGALEDFLIQAAILSGCEGRHKVPNIEDMLVHTNIRAFEWLIYASQDVVLEQHTVKKGSPARLKLCRMANAVSCLQVQICILNAILMVASAQPSKNPCKLLGYKRSLELEAVALRTWRRYANPCWLPGSKLNMPLD